jgi:hypothetical protein
MSWRYIPARNFSARQRKKFFAAFFKKEDLGFLSPAME